MYSGPMDAAFILSEQVSAGSAGIGVQTLVVYLLIFVGLWFLMIAPQRKKQKNHIQMVQSLRPGDRVVTTSGIFGTIAEVKEDRFVLEVANATKIEIFKSFIQTKLEKK